jgi:sulfatase maturation enzyme AslB (radical SAM superfamily)
MAERGIKGNTNRIRLEEHIPLDTPLHVFLDASSVCNFRCSFCPHGNGEAAKVMPQTVMPVELAKKMH